MSNQYDEYIQTHKADVATAFAWLRDNLPDIFDEKLGGVYMWNTCYDHDESKYSTEEYDAYDNYFYGNASTAVKEKFDQAWLHHIHANPHHWQYWILFEDDPTTDKPYRPLDMPDPYIIEMICDWWSFSFKSRNLYEIFDWYDSHKNKMMLTDKTRKRVEYILDRIKKELDAKKDLEES